MPFHFKCPHCNAKLEAEDDWNGMETQCPQCSKNITIRKEIKLSIKNEEIYSRNEYLAAIFTLDGLSPNKTSGSTVQKMRLLLLCFYLSFSIGVAAFGGLLLTFINHNKKSCGTILDHFLYFECMDNSYILHSLELVAVLMLMTAWSIMGILIFQYWRCLFPKASPLFPICTAVFGMIPIFNCLWNFSALFGLGKCLIKEIRTYKVMEPPSDKWIVNYCVMNVVTTIWALIIGAFEGTLLYVLIFIAGLFTIIALFRALFVLHSYVEIIETARGNYEER